MSVDSGVITALCIGDPHFKGDNKQETDMMEVQICQIITKLNPTFVVVLGDILHTHERIDLRANVRATSFLRSLKKVSKYLYVLIGNHDRQNNADFLTEDHVFNGLKEWDKTTCVDKVIINEHVGNDGKTYKFGFAPYVPPGRLTEALKTLELEPPFKGISGFFTHQEFKGAQMGAIKSTEGDIWDINYPLCVSGHIHEFERLQDNLIYTGTPIQTSYGDKNFKSISLITYYEEIKDSKLPFKHEHIVLDIPKRLQLSMNVEELIEYAKIKPDPRNKIKIKVKDEIIKIKHALELDSIKALIEAGIVIMPIDTTPSMTKFINKDVKTKLAFQKRLIGAINSLQDVKMKEEFYELFPNFKFK